ncbi:hypothetical protein SAMN05518861_12657 [Mesorhizobium sp. YR577]|nr:hypothetical protein SAMN05518861_12657 [Mesorhizobium sp. YR577]
MKGAQRDFHRCENVRRHGTLDFKKAVQPGMIAAELAKHVEAMPNLIAPVRLTPVEFDGADNALRDGRKKGALAAEMVVERHRRDAYGVSQAAW